MTAPSFQQSSPTSSSSSIVLPGSHLDSRVTLKHIADALMAEDEEDKNNMLENCVALEATEKPFYEAIGQKYPFNYFRRQSDCSSASSDEDDGNHSPNRRIHFRDEEDDLEDERSNKQKAIELTECDSLTEMFDSVVLPPSKKISPSRSSTWNPFSKETNQKTSRGRRQRSKVEVIDLLTMLTQCAQAVANGEQRTATAMLKQIKEHSSITGDVNQRLSHYISVALEARLLGLKTPPYEHHPRNMKMMQVLKVYQVYLKACPFHKISYIFANKTILKLAENARKLHIIDFGIMYGFQWPSLIQMLSEREGGPPTLKITGIELPQAGFKPAQKVKETLQRLKRYCERFNVQFESQVISKKWETIEYEDLELESGEMTVVNSMYRMKNVGDDTVDGGSPRDRVLNVIKKIRPNLLIMGVVNGAHNAPFFVTRFREAVFYYRTMFDMLEGTVRRESEERMVLEKEVLGRDIMNCIACEGAERVERPDTYKQWQNRIIRASFQQLPLDHALVGRLKERVAFEYDTDYVVAQHAQWLLHGWKGRITKAISLWKPL